MKNFIQKAAKEKQVKAGDTGRKIQHGKLAPSKNRISQDDSVLTNDIVGKAVGASAATVARGIKILRRNSIVCQSKTGFFTFPS